MDLERLGLVGNCQIAALVEASGSIVWCCLPRLDAEPVFGGMLDPDGGRFDIVAPDGRMGAQRYLENTNVLETVFDQPDGRFRILDFAPRFEQFSRIFRPAMLVRIVEPLEGSPRVSVRCDPVLGWSKARPTPLHGSNHVQFEGYGTPLRLTTDLALSYLDGRPFSLTARRRFVLTSGEPVEEPLEPLCDRLLGSTVSHWRRWVKHCDIPPHYQRDVIRSALALKLHCFEDTGAIVAAVTTSIPESPGSGRTWDYRFCWLRDGYYVVDAFRLLGQFDERDAFVNYLLNVAGGHPDLALSPLYAVSGEAAPAERTLSAWAGFNGDGPVRVGNAAAVQEQHDIFGEIVMALSPIFHDDRFTAERTPATLDLLLRLADRAISLAGRPDRGIWEYRSAPRPQTFSTLMCWAAADRAAGIASRFAPDKADHFRQAADRIRAEIATRAWSANRDSYSGAYDSDDLDASLLQMAPLRLFPADDARLQRTVDAVWRGLAQDGWLMRYREDDGLGRPAVAFVLCTFWLIEALAVIGRQADARAMMDAARSIESPLGLISEDYDTSARKMSGNFPQAYSHVGLIRAAFAASPAWRDVL
jgi:GH15 family glucan-1,4-alpha-glucosidase